MKDILKKILKVTLWIVCWSYWSFFAIAFVFLVLPVIFLCILIVMPENNDPYITEAYHPTTYRTSEDFYKLTGVKFPELEIVDSLFFDDRVNWRHEYKFVAKDGLNNDFKKRLKRACKTDYTH